MVGHSLRGEGIGDCTEGRVDTMRMEQCEICIWGMPDAREGLSVAGQQGDESHATCYGFAKYQCGVRMFWVMEKEVQILLVWMRGEERVAPVWTPMLICGKKD